MTQSFFQTFILLLLVTDPFGNVPLFVTALKDVAPARRPRIVMRECAIAFLLLLLFMFFGRHFLAALQLTDISLRIGGSVMPRHSTKAKAASMLNSSGPALPKSAGRHSPITASAAPRLRMRRDASSASQP